MNKKKIGALAALVLALLLVYGIWGNKEPAQSEAPETGEETAEAAPEEEEETFSASDYVEVAPYDSIEAQAAPVKEVDQADIQTEIDRFLAENEQLKEVLDRSKVQRGDTVGIDYTITLERMSGSRMGFPSSVKPAAPASARAFKSPSSFPAMAFVTLAQE